MAAFEQKPTDINDAQWRAVTERGGHLLVIAGPGTGKTHTLTYRIASLAGELKGQERILAITFTNKAAGEMRERLSQRFPSVTGKVTAGTFHSFCLQILRQFSPRTNLPQNFKVASPEQIEELLKGLWPDKSAAERKSALEAISRFKSNIPSGPVSADAMMYKALLRMNGVLDFDDLLVEALELFSSNDLVLKQLRDTYRYICVDEYQDINAVQHALLKVLVGPRGAGPAGAGAPAITAIGDPNQAIYGFRGSDVRFFESFTDDFPGAVTLSLNENYRSAANLLKASGQVIAASIRFAVPELTAKIYSSGRLTIHDTPTDKAEAEYVVHQIEQMVGGTSMFSMDSGRVAAHAETQASFMDFAVLYRLNSQRHALEEAFARSGIPFQVSVDQTSLDDPLSGGAVAPDEKIEKVNLLTLHAAKGLEFPVVFIVGCEEDLIPLKLKGLTSDPQEERRLFYVGMTRAKEKLFLVRARRRFLYGKSYEPKPSPFLADIEEQLKAYEEAQRAVVRKPRSREKQLGLFSDD